MRVLLPALDVFFTVLHGGIVLFLLFGWVRPRWRRVHRWLVLLTTLSWFVLGWRFGIGYCFLTDWHWQILARLGRSELPASFIKYAVDGLTGDDWDRRLIDLLTAGGFVFALAATIVTARRDRRARTTRAAAQTEDRNEVGVRQPALRWATAGLVVLAGSLGLVRAVADRWTADDAFISFRYALNWSRGLGPVYNAGERVEGYTNFLWTAILTPLAALRIDLEQAAIALGILCYGALLVLIARRGRWLADPDATADQPRTKGNARSNDPGGWSAVPLSFAAIALSRHSSVYATSGLETPLFVLLVTAGYLELARTLRVATAGFTRGFLLLTLACLTRPDGLLLYGVAALYLFAQTLRTKDETPVTTRLVDFLRPHLPFLSIYLPYYIARFAYYGLPWPNTFYAKSASEAYVGQGLTYAGLYFASYWFVPLLLAVALSVAWIRRRPLSPQVQLALAGTGAWCLYVIYVGGDFMFARFLVPITPLLVLAGEGLLRASLRHEGQRRDRPDEAKNHKDGRPDFVGVRLALAIVLALAALLRFDPYRGRDLPVIAGISEEHRIYTRANRAQLRATARRLAPALRAADPAVAFYGSQAALVYYWDLDRAIEAETGLTDRALAAAPLDERGRIGHEKQAGRAELRARRIDWALRAGNGPDYTRLKVAGLGEFEILCYRRRVMDPLLFRTAFDFTPFPEYLDEYLARGPAVEGARRDLHNFKKFYFDCNEDPGRFRQMARAAGMPR